LPLDLDQYPYLKRILEKVYRNNVTYKTSVKGAYDANWVKEYELFYNTQLNSTPYVLRVFFKEKKKGKIGFVHIRPVTDGSELAETYLSPPEEISEDGEAYLTCLDKYNEYGEKIECVPYIMPETIFGMCIHASIWICLKILERKGVIEKALCIPEIQKLVTGSPFADQQGMLFVQATRLIRMCRASAFYIINREKQPYLTDNQMLMELYSYVESGFPVIIGVDIADLKWWETSRHGYHSIVAIGHTMKGNKIDGFIFHDESALPYQKLTNDELLNAWHVPPKPQSRRNYKIREMLVAVPPQVSIPFYKVYPQFETIMSVLRKRGITTENMEDIVIRPMLKNTEDFMVEQITKNRPLVPMLLRALAEANFPDYLWIFYMYDVDADRKDYRNVKGIFLRDASGQTELRFLYLRDEKQAIYQVKKDRVYRLREGRKKREIL